MDLEQVLRRCAASPEDLDAILGLKGINNGENSLILCVMVEF